MVVNPGSLFDINIEFDLDMNSLYFYFKRVN